MSGIYSKEIKVYLGWIVRFYYWTCRSFGLFLKALGSVLVERIYNFHLLYIFSLESGLSIGSSSNARAPIKKTRLQSDACELFRSQQIIGRTFQIKQLFKVKIWRGSQKLNIVLMKNIHYNQHKVNLNSK